MRGLSLNAASRGHSSSRCAGLSLSRPLMLQSTGSRLAGSVVVAHGPSCSAACGILPDQGSNPCPLHWQADSQPLRHQGSPIGHFWSKMDQKNRWKWWYTGLNRHIKWHLRFLLLPWVSALHYASSRLQRMAAHSKKSYAAQLSPEEAGKITADHSHCEIRTIN